MCVLFVKGQLQCVLCLSKDSRSVNFVSQFISWNSYCPILGLKILHILCSSQSYFDTTHNFFSASYLNSSLTTVSGKYAHMTIGRTPQARHNANGNGFHLPTALPLLSMLFQANPPTNSTWDRCTAVLRQLIVVSLEMRAKRWHLTCNMSWQHQHAIAIREKHD